MLYIFDLLGVASFAVSGALAAGRKRMDIFGIVVIAIVTAIGGGTIRDVLLGIRPLLWIAHPIYIVVSVAAGLFTFVLARFVKRPPERALLILDAIGLAIFTVIGCQKAIQMHVPYVITPIMGVITGVAGGMIRDLLCGEIPLVLRKEIYATASLAGGVLLVVLYYMGANKATAELSAIALIIAMRLAAIYWQISLPTFPDSSDRKEQS